MDKVGTFWTILKTLFEGEIVACKAYENTCTCTAGFKNVEDAYKFLNNEYQHGKTTLSTRKCPSYMLNNMQSIDK